MALKIGRNGHFKGALVLVIYRLVALVELLAAILRVRTQERVCGPKGNIRIKNFELCQTRVEGKSESRMPGIYLFYAVFFYPKVIETKITINKYLIFVHGLQQTLSKYVCTAAKLGGRRLFKVALPETHVLNACPSRDLTSGGCFLFSPNIFGRT